jgi:hypothetical protein
MIQAGLFLIGRHKLGQAFGHRCLSIIGPDRTKSAGANL